MPEERVGKNGKRNVFYLGLVSLFTDLSSQMVYPLVPAFLAGLGASKVVIGLIEGIAESTAALFRTIFGRWSDKAGKRKIFIFFGYALSAFSRPFLFLANTWQPVLGVRFADRVGKAMRTPARDALISTSVGSGRKGMAFGFHRAMDRLGAVGGPLLALLVLKLFSDAQEPLRMVFLLSVIPAMLALIFIPFARETAIEIRKQKDVKKSGLGKPAFIVFTAASIVFTLGNASNAFLILKALDSGLPLIMVPVIWMLYNLFCALSSPLFGSLSDKVGRAPVIIISFFYYAVVYLLFGFAQKLWMIWILFGLYGIFYGLSEGVFRAHIADLIEPEWRASAYGIFNTGVGLALVPASIIFGAVWDAFGSTWAFAISAGFSLLGCAVFIISIWMRGAEKTNSHLGKTDS